MTKSMWVNFSCPCVQTFSCLIAWYTPTWNLKIHQLYEFVVYTSSQSGNERWQLMPKLAQFADVHFLYLNRKFLWQLKQHEMIDLNVSTPQRQSANNQRLSLFSFSLQIRVNTSFFQVICSVFFKGRSPGHLQKYNLLHVG